MKSIGKGEKKLYLLCLGLLLTFIGGTAWWSWLNIDPAVQIPTPMPPNPNALYYYEQAGKVFTRMPYGLAIDIYDNPHGIRTPRSLREYNQLYPFAVKAAWLKSNAAALKLARQGFSYPCQTPPDRTNSPSYYGYRYAIKELAEALEIEGHGYAQRGNWKEASNSALGAMRLCSDNMQGVPLGGYYLCISYQTHAREAIWETIGYLDANDVISVTRRLESLLARQPTYLELVQEQKRSAQARLLEAFHDKGWRTHAYFDVFDSASNNLNGQLAMLVHSKRFMMGELTSIFDARIANGRLPYAARKLKEPLPITPLVKLLTYDDDMRFSYARNETGNAMLLLSFALRAFQLEHGRYPATLDELSPHYLQHVSSDPFGGGEAMRYRSDGKTYTLWSIGPDGLDNGGKPIGKTEKQRWGTYTDRNVRFDSKGDIVSGINVPNSAWTMWLKK